jgi:signal transduction histidine kinase
VGESIDDLVMQISTELLGVGPEQLSDEIRSVLARVGSLVGVDRAYVLKAAVEERSPGELFEEWWFADQARPTTSIPALPWEAQRFWSRHLRSGETVAISTPAEVEPECPEAAAALVADGVQSILFVPLRAKDQPIGFIGIESWDQPTDWPEHTVARVRTVGELIVAAVERCHNDLERAAIAAALQERNEALERSNEDLQQFASVVSHDLNQPLVAIHGFLSMLDDLVRKDRIAEEPEAVALYVDRALAGSNRLRGLIDDVLAVAQVGATTVPMGEVDLDDLVRETVAELEAAGATAGATITVVPLPHVEGNRSLLGRLFQNLLSNSLKYVHPDRALEVTVEAERQGDRWVLHARDNGRGIPPEQRAEAMQMFTRLHDGPITGLGIGLAICARVAETHGGRLRLDGNAEGGLTVSFTLAPA